jgi:hypothetical protein
MFALAVLVSEFAATQAMGQIILYSGSFQTSSNATTRASSGATCSDPSGGLSVASASSVCADPDGNTAAASAQADVFVDTGGAEFSLGAYAGGTAAVGVPGPFTSFGNGTASANALRNWYMTNDTLYSM